MKTLCFPEQCGAVTALAWSPGGQQLAATCENGMAIVWNISSGAAIFCRRLTRNRLSTVSWTEHGRCLALGGDNDALTIIQVRDGALVLSQVFDAPIKKIACAPRGGRFLVAAGKTIAVYSEQWRTPTKLTHSATIRDVAWSPTGGRLAVVCEQGSVSVYNVLRRRLVYTLISKYGDEPCSVTWTTDGRDIAIGTARGTVQIHDGVTGHCFTTYTLSSSRISHLSWGNPCLAALDDHAEITLWDVLPREHSAALAQRYPPAHQAFAFSPDGEQIATCAQHVQHVSVMPAR